MVWTCFKKVRSPYWKTDKGNENAGEEEWSKVE